MWNLYQEKFGIELSKAAHVPYTKDAVSFIFDIRGYQVVVRTTYDPFLKDFSKKGSLYVVIRKGAEAVDYRQIHRKGNFQSRVVRFVKELVRQLKVRPNDSDNKPMVLKRVSYWELIWRSIDEMEEKAFYNGSPKEILDYVTAKKYYDEFGAKKKGVKKRLSEYKKTSTVGTPENVD